MACTHTSRNVTLALVDIKGMFYFYEVFLVSQQSRESDSRSVLFQACSLLQEDSTQNSVAFEDLKVNRPGMNR